MDSNWRSPLQADSGQRIVNKSSSLDSTAQTGNSEWQEEIYQKVKVLKDSYFAEIHDIYQKLCSKLQQHESPSQLVKPEVVEKLKFFKQTLECILQYLQIPQSGIQHFHKDRLATLEKQILVVLSEHRASQPCPTLQQGEIPQPHLQSLQQNQQSHCQIHQSQSHESGMNSKLESINVEGQGNAPIFVQQVAMGSIQENPVSAPQQASANSSTPHIGVKLFHLSSLDSTAHTGNSDWQEEIYQKIKVMKDLYFSEMHDIYQKMCAKLLQHDSLSQQTKSDGVDKLKFFKQMLERILQYLQISRNSIQPFHKDRLPTLENHILRILSSYRPRKPCPPLQQRQIPQPHLQSLQQNQQSQPHESGVNSQLQSVNVQGSSVHTFQPDKFSGLHGSLSFLSGINSSQPNMMDSFTEAPSERKRKRETDMVGYEEVAIPKKLGHIHASVDSTAHTANFDWQEEVYQKLKVMNDSYFADIHAIYQKMSAKLEQLESPSQQANAEAVSKLKFDKAMVGCIIQHLQIPKSNIQSFHKDRLPTLEKQILSILARTGMQSLILH